MKNIDYRLFQFYFIDSPVPPAHVDGMLWWQLKLQKSPALPLGTNFFVLVWMVHGRLLIDIALDDTMLSVYSQNANTVDNDVQRYFNFWFNPCKGQVYFI